MRGLIRRVHTGFQRSMQGSSIRFQSGRGLALHPRWTFQDTEWATVSPAISIVRFQLQPCVRAFTDRQTILSPSPDSPSPLGPSDCGHGPHAESVSTNATDCDARVHRRQNNSARPARRVRRCRRPHRVFLGDAWRISRRGSFSASGARAGRGLRDLVTRKGIDVSASPSPSADTARTWWVRASW